MNDYCCYFFNQNGYSLFPADIRADNLEDAKRHCFAILDDCALLLPMPPRSIEIWKANVMLF